MVLKYGKLENVSFENLDLNLIGLFTRCLNVLEIGWKNSYIKIFVQGWENYHKLYEYGLVQLNDFQYYKFLSGFYNCKEIRDLLLLKRMDRNGFAARDFTKKHNFKTTTNVLRKLRLLVKKGYLHTKGRGTKKYPYTFFITNETKKCFGEIEDIKKDIEHLESEHPEFEKYVKSLEKRQFKNKLKINESDMKFLNKLDINYWYNLNEIRNIVKCSRGHTNTVMPWLVRKGFAEKKQKGGKIFYRIIKTPL